MAKAKLKLDKRKSSQRKDGSYPLVLNISHKSTPRLIQLGYSILESQWDEDENKVKQIKDHKYITAKVQTLLKKAEIYIKDNAFEIETMSPNELKKRIEVEIKINPSTPSSVKQGIISKKLNKESLSDYLNQKINRLKTAKEFGYAEIHKTAHNRLLTFSGKTNLLFADIDINFLKNFEAYCKGRGNKPNTIGIYLRPIQTIFKEVVENGDIPMEMNPFIRYSIPFQSKTKKRALELNVFHELRKLKLTKKHLISAKYYFLFMFNNMGLNMVDMAKLTKSQIIQSKYDKDGLIEGRLRYNRTKTKHQFSIKLTKESIEILNYFDIANKSPMDKIFPIGFNNTEVGYKTYKQKRNRINGYFKEIAQKIGLDDDITSYFARHSWATIAKKKMLPISVISEGLGHADLKTTQIYLDSFDNDTLDDANDIIVG